MGHYWGKKGGGKEDVGQQRRQRRTEMGEAGEMGRGKLHGKWERGTEEHAGVGLLKTAGLDWERQRHTTVHMGN